MDKKQDQAVMDRWQELGRKEDPAFDVNDDGNHAYLFANFLPEDQEEAWSLIPEHREIRRRIEELEKGSATAEELGGIPFYNLPSKKNALPNDKIIELLKRHFNNVREVIDAEEYPDAYTFLSRNLSFEHHPLANDEEPDRDEGLNESCNSAYHETAFDAIPELDCYFALHEYVVYLTKCPDVTNYILTPCFKSSKIKSDSFEPAFRLYLANVYFWIKDKNTVQFCQHP